MGWPCGSNPSSARPGQEADVDITYRSIGVVRSPFSSVEGMPIQRSRAQDALIGWYARASRKDEQVVSDSRFR